NTAIQLSRDPASLTNVHSYKASGVNNKSISIAAAGSQGVTVTYKKGPINKPVASTHVKKLVHGGRRAIARGVAKIAKSTRADLSKAALARASRILDTQVEGKVQPVKKLRGKKAVIVA
ncbi:ribosomal L28e/Mak16, partial [Chytriomyces sp. MP71]